MMNVPLTLPMMMERAETYFPKKQVVSRTLDGIHRINYKELGLRTRKLSHALEKLGVKEGEKVGTFAWNHHRHLEAYFGIPGMGAVLHTINIRLAGQHISYIVNHAEDRVLLIDEDLLPLIEAVQDELKTVEAYVVMTDQEKLPETSLSPVYHYEKLLEGADATYEFKRDIDENAPAGMCFTSATTGNPKGVVYSHRSIVLHSMALGLADSAAVSESDVAMPVVPMFHANAWGLPFAAVWFGTTQVMPGPQFTPQALAELIESEKVTLSAGVPTIWLGLLRELDTGDYDTSSLRAVLCGGSAAPKGMIQAFESKYNIPFIHAYGMTETTPLVSLSRLKSYQTDLEEEERLEIRSKQGTMVPGVEMKVVGKDGEVAWDGHEMGELLLRGPWIADEYYQDDRSSQAFVEGWLHTGDVVTVDEEGTIKIVDRTKDLIKSGGEWISSVDLENALMAHEAVFEATVIAVPHEEWQERPLACVVLHDGSHVSKQEMYDYLKPQFAKWWLPDDIVFMKEIPKTSVGKFLKRALRDQLSDHFALAND
ncbi:long-chain-fatty-acid--CoA ligase [Pontibacillus yanchengensis]|uniref:Long-chain-fatty-acid--CoA ligase n=2 Tax=Pontibacillus yanchengensis TaxID=462910 RepID=A0A6I4ZQB7_9BACI|nr:long-chain fatty acid--CoA ligase [Pontibacillus yanchengensis]MYL32408.1 long-chain-fatty-acid--CoA ligase [Pontibacillus yanchengensis]MYL52989.1 long-chain-fatty-acid--CoA ligase [Pontibacillus yanchengensis]